MASMMHQIRPEHNDQYEQEIPEECPECHEPNGDEEGEWLCDEAPGFCSKQCAEAYEIRAHDEALAAAQEWDEETIRAHDEEWNEETI